MKIAILNHYNQHKYCDYVEQTKRTLLKKHTVVELRCPYYTSWRDTVAFFIFLYNWIHGDYTQTILTTPRVLPLRRFHLIDVLDIYLASKLVRLALLIIFRDRAIVFWLFHPEIRNVPHLLNQNDYLVYDAVDIYASQYVNPKNTVLLLDRASVATTISKPAQTVLMKLTKKKIHFVPQGFDITAMPTDSNRINKTKKYFAGYVGEINGRIDCKLLKKVMSSFPHKEFLIVGDLGIDNNAPYIRSYADFLSLPNVTWVRGKSRASAMELLSECCVAMIPYDTRVPFNQTCFPMKVSEYLYLGLPILSTKIPALEELQQLGVFCTNSSSEWELFLNSYDRRSSYSNSKMTERRLFALSQVWDAKISTILKIFTATINQKNS